jgi:hypothetical protein
LSANASEWHKGLGCLSGLRGRVTAKQVWGPKFKPQYHQKKKNRPCLLCFCAFFFFFFLVGLGFEFGASSLQSRCSTTWATPICCVLKSALTGTHLKFFFFFSLMGLGTRVWIQCFVLMKQMFYCWSHASIDFALVILEMGFLWTICQAELGSNKASQVARITGVSLWHLAHLKF